MPSYLQENISNSVFRGSCVNGVITITGYFDVNASTITVNSLRGAVVISKGVVVGYVANNTAWAGGGFMAYLAYNQRTESGFLDIQFVFPAGRLSFNTAQITSKSQGRIDVSYSISIESFALGRIDMQTYECGAMIRTNRYNIYDNEIVPGDPYIDPVTGLTITQQPPTAKVRTGIRVLY